MLRVNRILLKDFRLYDEAVFDFSEKVNLITGSNGQGKTSLLEAIYLLVTGRSFRTPHLAEVVRLGTEAYTVEATFCKHDVAQRLQVSGDGKHKRICYNATPCASMAEVLGILPGVVMTPDDEMLIKGLPQGRRRFLDLLLAQLDPLYVHHVMRFWRALKQRNWLLKNRNTATLEMWEAQMATSAAYIVSLRAKTADALSKVVATLYSSLAPDGETMSLQYRPGGLYPEASQDLATKFLQQYGEARTRELDVGHTLLGPHHDDVYILLSGQQAKGWASEGQKRSCLAALRLGEWQYLHENTGIQPLMLIDDLTMSLDAPRQKRLINAVTTLGQVFVTSVEGQRVLQHAGDVMEIALTRREPSCQMASP